MTIYEHAMLGIDGALAVGLHRRHGWQIVALAGFAAILPDWDGLTILLGSYCYAEGHRFWGHNLLVAGLLAAVVSGAACRWNAPTKVQRWLAKHWQALAIGGGPTETPPHRGTELCLWVIVGVAAAYSHLLIDVMFSRGMIGGVPMTWGVPLLWPFSSATCAYPVVPVPWGDIGTTLIFAAGMFAMLRRPAWVRPIAAGSLLAVAGYMALRGVLG